MYIEIKIRISIQIGGVFLENKIKIRIGIEGMHVCNAQGREHGLPL